MPRVVRGCSFLLAQESLGKTPRCSGPRGRRRGPGRGPLQAKSSVSWRVARADGALGGPEGKLQVGGRKEKTVPERRLLPLPHASETWYGGGSFESQ